MFMIVYFINILANGVDITEARLKKLSYFEIVFPIQYVDNPNSKKRHNVDNKMDYVCF